MKGALIGLSPRLEVLANSIIYVLLHLSSTDKSRAWALQLASCSASPRLLAHTSSNQPTRLAQVLSAQGPPGHTHYSPSQRARQPAKASKHMLSTQGMFLHKITPSTLGDVAVS